MSTAGPMMLKVIEENQSYFFLENGKGAAAKSNAVEKKGELSFPKHLLVLFSDADNKPAKLVKVSCLHMFESAPNDFIAISYVLQKANSEFIYLVLVFSVKYTKHQSILQCDQEVT